MFRGLTAVNIDTKGRVAIPKRYRETLKENGENLTILTIDTEQPCLLLYPFPKWQEIEQKLEGLSSFHPASRRIQRLLIGHATELELDGQHRILIPPVLREYASLDKTAMLVGQGKKFEIWSDSQWQSAREEWLNDGLKTNPEIPADILSITL